MAWDDPFDALDFIYTTLASSDSDWTHNADDLTKPAEGASDTTYLSSDSGYLFRFN